MTWDTVDALHAVEDHAAVLRDFIDRAQTVIHRDYGGTDHDGTGDCDHPMCVEARALTAPFCRCEGEDCDDDTCGCPGKANHGEGHP